MSNSHFVRTQMLPAQKPPVGETGVIKRNVGGLLAGIVFSPVVFERGLDGKFR
jgi:hypothetical protein